MSYLVLARKSRPQTFQEVVGQRPVVKTLQNSIRRNRIAHAILFSGVRGVGKTTIARLMAKAINCQAKAEERPCNQCPSCLAITAGNALDLTEIDGASNRGIQEIRDLKEKIRFLPTSSQYRIIIIDEVHMLTTEAFNALLKTLEEPPAHVYFMFATTEIHKIPVTILSRCQQYELKRVSTKELYDHFHKLTVAEGFEIEHQALSLIVREAAGSVRDGLSLLDQMFSFGEQKITIADVTEVLGIINRQVLLALVRSLLQGSLGAALTALAEIFSFSIDIKRFLEDLMGVFRSLLFCKIDGCTELIDLPDDELQEIQALAATVSKETIHLKLTLLMDLAEKLRNSPQPRLLLETSILKIIEAEEVIPISQLLGQVETILKSLPDGAGTAEQLKKKEISTTPPEKITITPPATTTAPALIAKTVAQAAQGATENTTHLPENTEQITTHVTGETEPSTPGETKPICVHPHEKDVRKDWSAFIQFVKEQKVWMAQDLQRADSVKQEVEGELQLTYSDAANCALLRQKENRQILTEFALDFFQKPLKIRFLVPTIDDAAEANNLESPQRKRAELANDPVVLMAAEIFNGEVGDIRISSPAR